MTRSSQGSCNQFNKNTAPADTAAETFKNLLEQTEQHPVSAICNYIHSNPEKTKKELSTLYASRKPAHKNIFLQVLKTDDVLWTLFTRANCKKRKFNSWVLKQNSKDRNDILSGDGALIAMKSAGYKKANFEEWLDGANVKGRGNILSGDGAFWGLYHAGFKKDDFISWINEQKDLNARNAILAGHWALPMLKKAGCDNKMIKGWIEEQDLENLCKIAKADEGYDTLSKIDYREKDIQQWHDELSKAKAQNAATALTQG